MGKVQIKKTETNVAVKMKGEKGSYILPGAQVRTIASWSRTLSDLTGYKAGYLASEIERALSKSTKSKSTKVTINTSCGGLCPIKFEISFRS